MNPAVETAKRREAKRASDPSPRPSRLPLILVAVLPLLTFWPVVSAEFIPLDDPGNVSRNPDFNPPALGKLGHYWVEPFHNMYAPLTYTAWAGLAQLAWMDGPDATGNQLNPYVFHAANLIVHLVNGILVYRLLRKLGGPQWGACAGALLFALHPFQVEPVAWVTCLRDLLCAAFALASLLAYVAGVKASHGRRRLALLAASCALLVAALLCKPTAVVIPAVAAALDWGILRRPIRAVARTAAGLLVVAVPFALVATRVQTADLTFSPPVWSRPLIVGDALAFYAGKLLMPVHLGLDYGRSPEWLIAQPMKWLALLALAALAGLLWAVRKRGVAVVAIVVALACLLPVLGLTKFDFQHHSTVADRYAYLAMLGPALLIALGVRAWSRSALVVAGLVLVLLAIRSHVQTRAWKDGASIYDRTLAVNPGSLLANRGMGQLSMSNPAKAEAYFRRALETKHDDAVTHFHMGNLYLATRRAADALPHYRVAVAKHDQPWVLTNFANALASAGETGEAESVLRGAAARHPESPELHFTLGSVLAKQGRRAEAAAEYRAALRINPQFVAAAEELAALERATSAPTSHPAQ